MRAVAGPVALLDRADVRPGMRVLDAGCGPGRLTIAAAERVTASGEVVALDVQEAMVARVRRKAELRKLPNVETVRGTIESAAIGAGGRSGGFDRALLVAVLGEVPDRARAMSSLLAALRPGGVLSVTEIIPDPHYQSRRAVRRLAEATGFVHNETFSTPFAFTMNLRKPE